MTLKLVTLLAEADRTLEREVTEAKISAWLDIRWEFNRFIDDLIAREEQMLNQQELQNSDEL